MEINANKNDSDQPTFIPKNTLLLILIRYYISSLYVSVGNAVDKTTFFNSAVVIYFVTIYFN